MSDKLKCPHCGSEAERAEKFQGYCFDCWNYDVPELRQQLAAITQERDAALKKADTLQKILSDSLELEKQYSEGYGQLQKERDALRDAIPFHMIPPFRHTVKYFNAEETVYRVHCFVRMKEHMSDMVGKECEISLTDSQPFNLLIARCLQLLTPSGEAGKGGGV